MRKARYFALMGIAALAAAAVLVTLAVSRENQTHAPHGQPATEKTLVPASRILLRLDKPFTVPATPLGKPMDFRGLPYLAMFSPRGDVIALDTLSEVLLWDVHRGKESRTLKKGRGWYGLAFSPDGKLLATDGRRCKVLVYDVATGARMHELTTPPLIKAVGFSPDGRKLFSWAYGPVRVWDVATGELLKEHKGHGEAWPVAFSPDGSMYAVLYPWFPTYENMDVDASEMFHQVSLWSLQTGKKLKTFAPVKGGATVVGFTPDGKYVASGFDFGLAFWEVATGKLLPGYDAKRNPGHGPPLLVAGDGWVLVSNAENGIRFHKLGTGRIAEVKPAGARDLRLLAVAPDGRTALGIHTPPDDPRERVVHLWRLDWPAGTIGAADTPKNGAITVTRGHRAP